MTGVLPSNTTDIEISFLMSVYVHEKREGFNPLSLWSPLKYIHQLRLIHLCKLCPLKLLLDLLLRSPHKNPHIEHLFLYTYTSIIYYKYFNV